MDIMLKGEMSGIDAAEQDKRGTNEYSGYIS